MNNSFCSQCGTGNQVGATFCSGCGKSIASAPQIKKKSRKWLYIVLGIVGVFVLFAIFDSDDDGSSDEYIGAIASDSSDNSGGSSTGSSVSSNASEASVSSNSYGASSLPYKFSAKDLNGNTVTEKTLGDKDVYFIHLWATWCRPCISEMPDLAKLARDYGNRVGFIGLVDDFNTKQSEAKRIVQSAGIPNSFIMINAHEPSVKPLLDLVKAKAIPTTTYLYAGEIFGPFEGAYGAGYATVLDKILNQ